MPDTKDKPTNCTCSFPEVVLRNMNGHDESCPVYIEWKTNCYPPYPKPKLVEATEISIKEFVESGALDEVNHILSNRGLRLDFHMIGDVYSNAVFIVTKHCAALKVTQ